jgi:hypothetical protein
MLSCTPRSLNCSPTLQMRQIRHKSYLWDRNSVFRNSVVYMCMVTMATYTLPTCGMDMIIFLRVLCNSNTHTFHCNSHLACTCGLIFMVHGLGCCIWSDFMINFGLFTTFWIFLFCFLSDCSIEVHIVQSKSVLNTWWHQSDYIPNTKLLSGVFFESMIILI